MYIHIYIYKYICRSVYLSIDLQVAQKTRRKKNTAKNVHLFQVWWLQAFLERFHVVGGNPGVTFEIGLSKRTCLKQQAILIGLYHLFGMCLSHSLTVDLLKAFSVPKLTPL